MDRLGKHPSSGRELTRALVLVAVSDQLLGARHDRVRAVGPPAGFAVGLADPVHYGLRGRLEAVERIERRAARLDRPKPTVKTALAAAYAVQPQKAA